MRYYMLYLHMPGYDFVLKAEHLFSDKRFWAIVGITVIFAGLMTLLIWAGQGTQGAPVELPFSPGYPYLP